MSDAARAGDYAETDDHPAQRAQIPPTAHLLRVEAMQALERAAKDAGHTYAARAAPCAASAAPADSCGAWQQWRGWPRLRTLSA